MLATESQLVVLLYNPPALAPENPDFASEAGVLESVEAIGASLRPAGYRFVKVTAHGPLVSLARGLDELRPDVVVNLCEGFAGRSAGEPHVAALLELFNVPYTGSPPECLSLVQDKVKTKHLLAGAGVATPDFIAVPLGESPPERQLRKWLELGPLIVKPSREDASLGIDQHSVVTEWTALPGQVLKIHDRYGDALVERYIAGRELNVGIIELAELQVLPLVEIDFQIGPHLQWPIVTYRGKWSPQSPEDLATPVRCPADVTQALRRQIEQQALAAYRLTSCRDYARIDVRVDDQGRVFVLEVNANPDVGPSAGLARMLSAARISYDEFAGRLVENAAARRKPENTPLISATECESRTRLFDAASNLEIRHLRPDDVSTLVEIARACKVFRPDEVDVAAEVLHDAVRDGPDGDYHVLVAEMTGRMVGWSCHGRVPLTDGTFDLYWIVIAPEVQHSGIGRKLLAEVEDRTGKAGGRWLLAETSSTNEYQPTRTFYLRCGYGVLSEIQDFYRPGDGRIIFGKRIDRP